MVDSTSQWTGERPAQQRNSSVSLKAYLEDVADAVRSLPSAWVKCELHVLKAGDKFVRMEFIELDQSGRQVAKVSGGCFPSAWRRITAEFSQAGLPLEAGSQVLVRLESHMNAVYGFQVNVLDMDVTFALGDLSARIQHIRKTLREVGHWDRNKRLARPDDFVRVAVISPASAAGLGDFRSSADHLDDLGLVRFDYYEAPFQTKDAPERIVAILRDVYRKSMDGSGYCAVAIIRGGGASADLAWLVDHKLAEAVCRMNIPVMTGIGHERDRNLLDEVACIPCDTPSKVVEYISRTVTQAANAGRRSYEQICSHAAQVVERASSGLSDAVHSIDRDAVESLRLATREVQAAATALEPDARRLLDQTQSAIVSILDDARAGARATREDAAVDIQSMRHAVVSGASASLQTLESGASRALGELEIRVEAIPQVADDEVSRLLTQIRGDAVRMLDESSSAITLMQERADALHPGNVLAAGYAILRGEDGRPLMSVESVKAASTVQAEMRDGEILLAHSTSDALGVKPVPTKRKPATTSKAKAGATEKPKQRKTDERSDDQGA